MALPKAPETEPVGFPGDDDYDDKGYADADSLLGAPVVSATFPEIGASVGGTILDVTTGDQRDPDGKVRTFENGDVRRQVIVTLQTEDKEADDDDGRRRLFIKGGMMLSVRRALREIKAPGLRPGGVLAVTYTGDGEQKQKGMNPPKLFAVEYTPPA